MLEENRMVALCTCRIQDKESHRFISKLDETLKEINCNLIVYNCSSYIGSESEDYDPQLPVFDLIDKSVVSAVIVQADRFNNHRVCRKIIDDVKMKKLPVIVLGEVFEDCLCITYKHQTGFADTIRHLIHEHGKTKLHLIAGLKNNKYSDERIETFREVLAENGLPFDESMVSYGDYWPTPAQKAAIKLIEENRLPEAFVCANDNMAIAVAAILKKYGIAVPEEVAVTGFDCIEAIYSSEPTITSAYISSEVTTNAVLKALEDIFSGNYSCGIVELESAMVINGSCGCKESKRTNSAIALTDSESVFCFFQDDNIQLAEAGAKIQKCTDFSQVLPIMENSYCMRSMSCFLREECIDEKTDLNCIDSNIGNRLFMLYDSEFIVKKRRMGEEFEPYFITTDMLNKGIRDNTSYGFSIVFSSLYYLDKPLGYVCFHFKEGSFSDCYRIPQIVNILNNAFGGMMNLRHSRYLMSRIDEMYRNDHLTDLYNRRGFCIEYDSFLEKNKGKSLSVVMCDLDGLKGINDNYGHEAGDDAIRSVAKALKHAAGVESVCTRMGGDEMLAVYVYTEGSDEIFRNEFEGYLDNVNSVSDKEYKVAASVGIYHTRENERLSFEELIKRSDVLMYSEKKRRKQQK